MQDENEELLVYRYVMIIILSCILPVQVSLSQDISVSPSEKYVIFDHDLELWDLRECAEIRRLAPDKASVLSTFLVEQEAEWIASLHYPEYASTERTYTPLVTSGTVRLLSASGEMKAIGTLKPPEGVGAFHLYHMHSCASSGRIIVLTMWQRVPLKQAMPPSTYMLYQFRHGENSKAHVSTVKHACRGFPDAASLAMSSDGTIAVIDDCSQQIAVETESGTVRWTQRRRVSDAECLGRAIVQWETLLGGNEVIVTVTEDINVIYGKGIVWDAKEVANGRDVSFDTDVIKRHIPLMATTHACVDPRKPFLYCAGGSSWSPSITIVDVEHGVVIHEILILPLLNAEERAEFDKLNVQRVEEGIYPVTSLSCSEMCNICAVKLSGVDDIVVVDTNTGERVCP